MVKHDNYIELPSEVFGTMELAISLDDIESGNEHDAIMEAYSKINDENVHMYELVILNSNNEIQGTLKVHNIEVNWNRYFSKGEA